MGITACLIIGSMSGCSSKENGNSQSNQKEQTIQINQTEEEISENEDVKNEEELQPITVTVDYAEAFQSIQGCAVILNSENNTYTFYKGIFIKIIVYSINITRFLGKTTFQKHFNKLVCIRKLVCIDYKTYHYFTCCLCCPYKYMAHYSLMVSFIICRYFILFHIFSYSL